MSKEDKENVVAEFDSVFIKKVVSSRNSFLLWIPKDEAEFLELKDGDFIRVCLKKIKKGEKNNE